MQAVSNSLPHHASRVWSFGGGLRLRDRAASEQLCDVSASISLNGPTEPPLIEAPQPALLWAAPPRHTARRLACERPRVGREQTAGARD